MSRGLALLLGVLLLTACGSIDITVKVEDSAGNVLNGVEVIVFDNSEDAKNFEKKSQYNILQSRYTDKNGTVDFDLKKENTYYFFAYKEDYHLSRAVNDEPLSVSGDNIINMTLYSYDEEIPAIVYRNY
ncbi:MAG TPA: hypothetical protein VKS21_00705 [Spirochaetota bacterium]|nr:hypothetical protein [Spirochaetota bacterium]